MLDNDKKINKPAKRRKKMSNHQKEDWRLLSFYDDYYSRKSALEWVKRGDDLSKTAKRLKKQGYLNFNPKAKEGNNLADLKYGNCVITNKGWDYFDKLHHLHNEDITTKAKIVAAIAGIMAVVFAIVVWLAK